MRTWRQVTLALACSALILAAVLSLLIELALDLSARQQRPEPLRNRASPMPQPHRSRLFEADHVGDGAGQALPFRRLALQLGAAEADEGTLSGSMVAAARPASAYSDVSGGYRLRL